MPNPKTGPRGPPLFCCPRPLTEYIHTYPPHQKILSTICNLRTHHAAVTRDILSMPFLRAGACTRVYVCALCKRIISAVRKVKPVIDRMSYI
jgi:hypothetical protein